MPEKPTITDQTVILDEIARSLGARIIGAVPEVGGGQLGAAHLARIYQDRMAEVRAAEPPVEPEQGGRADGR